MYRLLREIHGCVGLFALPFLGMYGLSALQMAHSDVLKATTASRSYEVRLPAVQSSDDARLVLTEHYGLRGELKSATQTGLTHTLQLERPGAHYDVTIIGTKVSVTETRGNSLHVINRMHHLAGMSHSSWVLNVWGLGVVLLSLLLLGLGISGAWMWLKRPKDLRLGLLFLGSSLLYCITLLTMIRLAG